MSARFTCPHCGKEYPILPSLLGRKVRCKGCSQAFVLGSDGTAAKVEEAQQPSVERRRHFEELSQNWARQASTAVVQRKAAYSTATAIPVTRSITSREEARARALRADLSAAADKAAAALLDQTPTGTPLQASAIAPVLRGSGAQRGRRRTLALLAVLASAALGAGLWLFAPPSDPDLALLDRIGTEVATPGTCYWIEPGSDDGDPMLLGDPGSVALGDDQLISIESFAADIAPLLRDRRPSLRLGAFVRTDRYDDVRSALLNMSPPLRRDRAITLLRDQGFDLLLYEDLAAAIEGCIPNGDACQALARLIAFAAAEDDDDSWRRLLAQQPPRTMRIRPVRGTSATILQPEGNRLRAQDCPAWVGSIVQISGEAWPTTARVLSCRPFDRLDDDGGPLRLAARQAERHFAGRR